MKRITFKILQHLLMAFIAFGLTFAFAGTSIVISTARNDYSYNLYESDRNRTYEDSYLFNNIFGNNLSDVFKLVAERTQLETAGEYDGDKVVDVTAFVNRGTTLPGDYITAKYSLSDLLKWSQSGFQYEKRNFSETDTVNFLSHYTTYTHLDNNLVSGGMNSYLSSQLDNNSSTFTISGNSSTAGGEHTILISRYQTIDGKNVEDIVSNWEEYNTLCSYIEEAANTLANSFEDYGTLIPYYSYQNSNLRYYITRTINGRTDVYTNVDSLKGETTGVDIKSIFMEYGKYMYYCPYDLEYDTNTRISESVVRSLIKNYSYAYPDQIKVYVAVDTVNYPCTDDFTQGKQSFSKYMPYRTQLIILCAFAGIIYIVLMTINLKLVNAPETVTKKNKYTEGIVLWGLLIMAIPVIVNMIIVMLMNTGIAKYTQLKAFPFIAGLSLFVADIGFLGIIFGLYSKAKNKSIWKDSFVRKIALFSKNIIVNTTDNGNVIIRTWIPYVAFLVLNILLLKLGLSGMIIAIFIDILVGIYLYRQNMDREKIIHVIENIKNGDVKAKVDISELHSDNIALADAVNSIGEGIDEAVNVSMKDEKLKADLITNVSHDIKTPLTSIINYVDLMKREDIDNERVKEYLNILDIKSQKLKQLTEDLVEASKISSGNISITLTRINFVELVNQTIGEFYEKFEKSSLQPIFKPEMDVMVINADARHLWRVLENLVNNVCKYALSGTRVYMDMRLADGKDGNKKVVFSIKNISASELNIDAEELTERFIRGDQSRTTEGSGLGLSIAKNLTVAQGGDFEIKLDGDLFKVIISFDALERTE